MNRTTSRITRVAAALLLATSFAAVAHADLLQWQPGARPRTAPAPRRHITYEVAGIYGGSFSGSITIDGTPYPVSPGTSVYRVGVGRVPLSQLPIGSRIYAVGQGVRGQGPIRSLVARPAEDAPSTTEDMSRFVRVADPNRPN